ncbi:MAG TPA: DUF4446 family protein, partial [Firmicutes bacterium]|nr:DUF4446 family protein [Bacillota bacterium]
TCNLEAIVALLEDNYPFFWLGLLAVQLLFLLLIWYNFTELRRLKGRLRRLIDTGSGYDLAELLERCRYLGDMQRSLEHLQEKAADLQVGIEKSISRAGLVRFNAFNDISSDLSFALALLSREGNGFIITSLYSREDTRVFIKSVQEGRATNRLSEEEENALAMALGLKTPDTTTR